MAVVTESEEKHQHTSRIRRLQVAFLNVVALCLLSRRPLLIICKLGENLQELAKMEQDRWHSVHNQSERTRNDDGGGIGEYLQASSSNEAFRAAFCCSSCSVILASVCRGLY